MSQNSHTGATLVLRLYAVVLVIIGLMLVVSGGHLLSLGGSPYYVLCGVAMLASAVLLWLRRGEGTLVYGLMLLASLVWALWEVGAHGWLLMPRLLALAVLGVVLMIPAVRNALIRRSPMWSLGRKAIAVVSAAVIGVALHATIGPTTNPDPMYQAGVASAPSQPAPASAQTDATGDWQHYGSDVGGSRYSALAQITIANVSRLERVWTFRLGTPTDKFGLETTPIKIDRTLYMCSAQNDIFALNAETGELVWRYNPRVDATKVTQQVCRGVAYYKAPNLTGACAERIYTATIDARLIAVDAHDGKPCEGFGTHGQVSLLTGMGDVPNAYYYVTSAPAVIRGKLVLGGWVADNQYWGEPSGVIRAFDALTGKLAWAWDAGHPDRQGEPPEGETYTRSSPNSWSPISADEKLGLVYVPTGNATPDYWGVYRRPFDEKYSSATVAIDAETGIVRWSFQTAHHDLWDYDIASQPTLIDLPSPDGSIPALIQPTKRGELFVLNRVTGKPVKAVEERSVPTEGALKQERISPTQPFSVGVPSFRGPTLREADMWGITPLDQLWCRVKFREARYGGPATPPGLTPAIEYPGYTGGMEWGGAAADAPRGIAIINTNYVPTYPRIATREEANKLGLHRISNKDSGNRYVGSYDPQEGTPYAILTGLFMSPLDVPCTAPPFGRISAVDLTSGKLLWSQPFGTARGSGPLGMHSELPFLIGTPNLGGAVVTRGGIFFIGAAQDGYLRAYETATGKELWRYALPTGGQATPMTYLSPESGRQFVVIAAGGHKGLNATPGDYIVGFTLPKTAGK
jgi:quinoprotein glucose dehydrogenase